MKILRSILVLVAGLSLTVCGCRQARVTQSMPDLQGAAACITNTYPSVIVTPVDSNALGVIWESGAEAKFLELKTKVKTDFGVDVVITAVE